VTAFAPAGVVAAFAAQVPEAMWVAWPLAADGTLSAAASALLWQRLDRASALLCGPGMGRSADVDRLLQQIVSRVTQPLLLDADALQPEVLDRIAARGPEFGPVVLTPHMGEYMRLGGLSQPDYSSISLRDFSSRYRLITVLKCAHTRICDGSTVLYNVGGGPVLSRGGSGDLLAGLIGGLLAQPQEADLEAVATAVAQGVYLHSRAAECLARQEGQVAVTATCLLDFLPAVLRDVN
jgi:NAD(P)H-hydrate epimerase